MSTPLLDQKQSPILQPLEVTVSRISLQPGEYLFIAVDPRSWDGAKDIDALLRMHMRPEDYRRVFLYQKGHLEITAAKLGAR
jgi:hypothetical protein